MDPDPSSPASLLRIHVSICGLLTVMPSQKKYALQLISQVGLAAAKPISTPIELNQKITTINYDKYVKVTGDEELLDVDNHQKLIGKLLYLTTTRPNICFTFQKQQVVSQSSAEAEYRSLAAASPEIIWFLGLLKEFQVTVHEPVVLYCDSKVVL
uniref:Retrovirus-related Pol polyprotein from transposon TNT 1-94 n=2 Tax=Nicotiana TaxID=4085 RepID=A0A1S3YM23_TOBAC|nr:PREDICTED: uncharacterized protein LOC104221371 [Nicotiana sylvestris]XP_016453336.1 PREDICTED: uncharacterized protein LOC107777722 [Nicotiana tabacum]